MIAILTSKLGLAGIALALVLAVFGIQAARLHHADAEIAKALADAAKTDVQTAQVSAEAAQSIATERTRIQTVTKTIIRKVPVYVPAAADADCVVNSGFVQLLDGAAQVPTAARGPLEAPSGVPLSAVAATVTENYGVALDWRAEALGWRDWYKREASAWGGKH